MRGRLDSFGSSSLSIHFNESGQRGSFSSSFCDDDDLFDIAAIPAESNTIAVDVHDDPGLLDHEFERTTDCLSAI
jgi:hypothetical protein